MRTLVCLLLLLCFTGCELPLAKNPIGTPWQSDEVSKLNATWVLEGLGTTVTLVGQKDGHAMAGMIETKPNTTEPLKLIRIDCVFTRVGKHEMVFFKGIEEEKKASEKDAETVPAGYLFWLVTERDANVAKLALPTDAFKTLFDAGKLPGEVVKIKKAAYTVIDADEKTLLAAIDSLGIEKCFDMKQVETARRVVVKKSQ